MGFLAGFSFISRFCKSILTSHNVWHDFDEIYRKYQEKLNKKKEDVHLAIQVAV
jgi:predicted helicase